MATFGQRLRQLREENKLSQQDMIDYLGHRGINISKGTYSKWESDTHEVGFSALDALCDYFKVSADYLLCRSEKRR